MGNDFENSQDPFGNPNRDNRNEQAGQNSFYTDPNAGCQYNNGYNYYQGNSGNQNMTDHSGMDQTPMTMGDWVLTILAMMLPCVGIILYLVWAFGKSGNVNRRNFCRAWLIIYAILMALSVLLIVVLGFSTVSLFAEYGTYY